MLQRWEPLSPWMISEAAVLALSSRVCPSWSVVIEALLSINRIKSRCLSPEKLGRAIATTIAENAAIIISKLNRSRNR